MNILPRVSFGVFLGFSLFSIFIVLSYIFTYQLYLQLYLIIILISLLYSFTYRLVAVRIYFTHLEDGPDDADWKHAVMEPLEINDQGQIANWPKGFMDDDLEEANRWLAALERQRSLNDEE